MAKFFYFCLFVVLTYLGNDGGVAVGTQTDTGEANNTTLIPEAITDDVSNETNTTSTPTTTPTPTPTSNTTVEPNTTTTTSSNTTMTPSNLTTPMVTPNSTSEAPSNTTTAVKPITTPMSTTPIPSKAPAPSHFNVGSFFGGIFLGVIVTLCCFFLLRWYINKRKANPYRTV